VTGAEQLAATGASLRTIADACGVSKETVRRWRSGEALPDEAHRRRLCDVYGIDPASWDGTPRPGRPVYRRPRRSSSASTLRALLRHAEAQLEGDVPGALRVRWVAVAGRLAAHVAGQERDQAPRVIDALIHVMRDCERCRRQASVALEALDLPPSEDA
jgi:transcriptional regulator with XRE-family HTH domain